MTVLPAIVMDALDAVHSSEHFRPHTDNNTKNHLDGVCQSRFAMATAKGSQKKIGTYTLAL